MSEAEGVKGSFLKRVITCVEGVSATKDLCRFRLKDSKTDGMLVLASTWIKFLALLLEMYFLSQVQSIALVVPKT